MSFKHSLYSPTKEEQRKGFALIMQGSEGDAPPTPPSFSNSTAQFKYSAWKELLGVPKIDAQKKLVVFVKELEKKYKDNFQEPKNHNRVDTHFHIVPDFYAEAVEANGGDKSGFPLQTPSWSLESAKKQMKLLGISHGVMSVTAPGAPMFPGQKGRDMARKINEYSAGVSKQHPDHFSYFASLPSFLDVEGVLKEIDHAMGVLGAVGIVAFTSYGDRYLGHPSFEPIWENLNKRKAVVFTHPCNPPYKQVSKHLPTPFMDFTLETTRTAGDLVTSGTKTKYSDIKFILSHAGGAVPFLAPRIAMTGSISELGSPVDCVGQMEAFHSFYFDTALSTSPAQLKALLELADPDRILYGSDLPYAPLCTSQGITDGLDAFFNSHGAAGTELLRKINYKNAEKLFGKSFKHTSDSVSTHSRL